MTMTIKHGYGPAGPAGSLTAGQLQPNLAGYLAKPDLKKGRTRDIIQHINVSIISSNVISRQRISNMG